MTRKDYIKAASQIREQRTLARTKGDRKIVDALQQSLASMFAQDNPRFDRTRFDQACEPVKAPA